MYQQTETIAKSVENIQKQRYLLPAIQREIVWERDQITDLFDSVLQGYPIGTFLFWNIDDEKRDDYKMYGFIQDFIKRRGAKYIQTSSQYRNSEVKPDGVGDLKLILDGQQRLSSFYIGLRGTYTYRKHRGWIQNPDAWKKSKLYFNITSNPNEDSTNENDRNIRYIFKFLPTGKYDSRLVERGENLWLRAGTILDYSTDEELNELIYGKIIPKYRELDSSGKEKYIQSNVRKFWSSVHDNSHITYFEETEQNIEKVLDIFIRTNDGGTELQKSDLLLSIAVAQWDDYDAREELTTFVDHLNTKLPSTNDYNKDFILKSSLVLTGLQVQYRVGQFNRKNVAKIEKEWPEIRDSIEQAAKLVNYFGIDENTLPSKNSVIPIAYFFKKTGLTAEDLQRRDQKYSEVKQDIKKWFLTSLLNGTFGGNPDSVLKKIREELDKTDEIVFPVESINDSIRELQKIVGFDEETAENVLGFEKGKKRTFLALSLLYPKKDWGSVQYHQDHIFPESKLDMDDLINKGIKPEKAKKFEERRHELSNLQLLTEKENKEKGDKPFLEWLESQEESTQEKLCKKHFIPKDSECYKLENFDDFLEKRKDKIKDHLMSILT